MAEASITEVSGKIKVAGKTSFVLELCRSVLDGTPFLGKPTSKRPVVYLTEQPRASFRVALRRAKLLGRDDFVVLRWSDVIGVTWKEVAAAAVERRRSWEHC